jgi:hypothetical protein
VVGEEYHAFLFWVILLSTLRCNNNLDKKIKHLLIALGLGLGLTLTVLAIAGRLTPIWAAGPEDRTGGPIMGRFEPDLATQKRVGQALGKLPLRFIPNVGQIDPEAHFTIKGNGQTLFFTDLEVVLAASGLDPTETTDPVEKLASAWVPTTSASPW